MSTTFDSCVPNPVCKSGTYKFDGLKDVQSINDYLGDNSKINWQAQGNPIQYPSGGVALTMAEGTVGTLLASTFYVWYGKICATMSTSQGQGVVTAFIMMSDVKDEIDFEFIGNDVGNAQSNWYSQGVTNCKLFDPLVCTKTNNIIRREHGEAPGQPRHCEADPRILHRLVSRRTQLVR